jgi:integrase
METVHKLTDKAIKNAQPDVGKEYRLSDGGGLYLVIKPNGGKLWRWSYEFNGKEKLLSYGPYGPKPFVTLADARQMHAAARALKRDGIDPAADKQAKKRGEHEAEKAEREAERASAMPTFAELTEKWLETWSKNRSKRYVATVKNRLERDILPVIGATKVDQLKASELADIVTGIQDDREAADLARRALQKMKQILRFAKAKGYIESSPLADTLPGDLLKSHTVANFARIEPKDLPGLLQKIELYHGNPLTRLAMKLMALTFVRTESLICAEWSEFDFEAKRWNIPKEHMKGKKFPHIVPLAQQTIEVLQLLRTLSGMSKYLFPGQGPKNPTMSNGTICKALEAMGYKGEMTGHGFRGVASTIMHECGHRHEYIETQMAHQKKDKVSGAYDHAKYLIPRTYMMQDWADFLDETLRGGKYKLIPPSYRIEREQRSEDDLRSKKQAVPTRHARQ